MKPQVVWFTFGLIALVLAGVLGDVIFPPHPPDFSFRVMSGYIVAFLLLLAAAITFNTRKQ